MKLRVYRAVLAAILVGVPSWWAYNALTHQTDEALRAQRPVWAACPEMPTVECATIRVPLDHEAPEEHPIDLALARLPARHPDERIGSLVVNYGGPGIAGVAMLIRDPELFDELRSRYDIVAFDPRGVGRSTPLNCRPKGEPLPSLTVDQTPDTPKEQAALVKAVTAYADACRRQAGWLVPHLTTDATARDLDILRSVLGDRELTYFGYSYGGGLGVAYAQLFPDKVGRMVLDAPSVTAGGGPVEFDPKDLSDEGINAFVEDCVKRRGCPLGDDLDLGLQNLNDFVQVRDGLPLDVSGGELTDALATEGVIELLYTTDDWPRLRRALADGLKGDGQALYDAAMEFEAGDGLSMDANIAINCNDTSTRFELDDIARQVETAREKAPISGAWQAWNSMACTGWDIVVGNTWLADLPRYLSPVMIVGTEGDPVVPYAAVRSLATSLSESVLVTLRGKSHTAYRSGDRCVNEAVEAYLLDGKVPADEVKCPAGTRKS
ncbi:alpha/beta fold hydrolase [Nonomuraea phyllanthi]|uniref:Alpha/beta fold hydrolase n=1 Tax=Nonomuraea phyllanthi TaxID=2219224 RepID=A0A5C4WFG2_9ACTN|nr:alpha/beta hydrolase [Nonomuraea phyllanthi]KAB8193790.1 alpha/beta fold hydrolase [Nonomuraea phyllanthi]